MPGFLVNYGGPKPTISSMESTFSKTIEACEKFYNSPAKSVSFTRNGLNLTYYQVGIHRMIKVELPEQVKKDLKSEILSVRLQAEQTQKLYTKARIKAGDFNTGKYKLLANNCVTAVANVLNIIDPDMLHGKKKVVPLSLDSNVNGAVLFESMVDESLRGTMFPKDTGKHKDYIHSDSVASQVWRDVMTPVGKQCHMKEQMKTMKSAHHDDTVEQHVAPKSPN